MPKVKSEHVYHQWIQDKLRPVTKWDLLLDRIAWAWRKPYGWLLAYKRHFHNALVGWNASRHPYTYKKGPSDV